MMTEETVYEEQQQCRHVNQKSCFNAYKTVYKTTQVIAVHCRATKMVSKQQLEGWTVWQATSSLF